MSGPGNWLRVPLPEVSLGPGSFHWEMKRRPLQLPQPWDRVTSVIISLWMLSFPGEATGTQSESPGVALTRSPAGGRDARRAGRGLQSLFWFLLACHLLRTPKLRPLASLMGRVLRHGGVGCGPQGPQRDARSWPSSCLKESECSGHLAGGPSGGGISAGLLAEEQLTGRHGVLGGRNCVCFLH